ERRDLRAPRLHLGRQVVSLRYHALRVSTGAGCARQSWLSREITGRFVDASYPCRLSRYTPCSPSRFQVHHGALKRSARRQASSATDFSILAPTTSQSSRKSLIVQKWMLGESHHA